MRSVQGLADTERIRLLLGWYGLEKPLRNLAPEVSASRCWCTTPAASAEVASPKFARLCGPRTSPVPGGVEGRTGEVAERRTSVPPSQAKVAGERSEHRAAGTNEEWSEVKMISVGLLLRVKT